MPRSRSAVVLLLLLLSGCELIAPEDDDNQPALTALARSATTLQLQWDSFYEADRYTVDYFVNQTDCVFPAMHSDVQQVTGTSVTLTGLTPATLYQIHVHDIPDYKNSTNLILIRTLEPGAALQPVTSADYTSC